MIQIIIVVVYFVLTLVLGLVTTRAKTSKAYDGTGLGIIACVAVGAGEWIGGTSTSGVAEYGYKFGMSGTWYTIANGLGIIFLAIFLSKLFRKLNQSTVSGILAHYVGKKARLYAGIVQMIILIIVGTSQIISIGSLVEVLFGWPSWSHIPCMFVVGGGILLFTVLGGMKAIGKTNVMHLVFMYIGAIIAVIVILSKIGGFSVLTENLDGSFFNMGTIGPTKITSWCLASILGSCVAQAGLQPVLTAKDEKTAQRSSFITALLVAPFGILTAILGICSRYLHPELLTIYGPVVGPKMGLPTLLMNDISPIIGGLVMAALFGAIFSTIGPIFLSIGTIFGRDIYPFVRKNKDENAPLNVNVNRLASVGFGMLVIVASVFLYDYQAGLDIVYFAYSLRAAIFVVLLAAILWKQVTSRSANITIVAASACGLIWIIMKNIFPDHVLFKYVSETYITIAVGVILILAATLIDSHFRKKELAKECVENE